MLLIMEKLTPQHDRGNLNKWKCIDTKTPLLGGKNKRYCVSSTSKQKIVRVTFIIFFIYKYISD